MDERYIRRHNIIDRYLLRQLSEEEQCDFELYYFEHPEMLKELQLARAMRDGLAMLSEQGDIAATPSLQQRLLAVLSQPWYGGVATAAACLLVAALLAQRTAPPPPAALSPDVQPVVATLRLERMRGSAGRTTVTVDRAGAIFVNIDAAGLDPASLKGTISGAQATIADLPLVAGNLGLTSLVVPSARLPPGDYTLELHDARGERLSYDFRVQR